MAYQSLYRRYRPQRFAEIRGQEHLVRALQNAVREDRVGHAYLFSGPRGTGKTSTARILAKVLNCERPVDGEPCCACESCRSIEAGTSFDVHELDAASNNGVDAIRELITRASHGTPGRTKVYILDEVHMLSTAASNALLKTLEEPPPHVVFVLATTDPQKVLPTIRSRTQHYEVHLLPAAELEALVDHVIADAGLEVTPEGREHALRVGAGSARDTLSALDQVVASGGSIDDGSPVLDELVEALAERDTGRALVAVDRAIAAGRAPRTLGEELIGRLRDVFLASVGADLARLSDRAREVVEAQAGRLGAAGTTRALEVLGDAFVGIGDAPDPRITLEVALVRLTRPDAELNLAALADRISRLERGLGAAAPAVGPAPVTAAEPVTAGSPEATGATTAPGAGGGGRPADSAREVLARRRAEGSGTPAGASGARPGPTAAPPQRSRRPAPTRASSTAPLDRSRSGPEPSVASVAEGSGPGADVAGLPSRDELTLAWGDSILASLAPRVRSRFATGRWLAVEDGVAVFAAPNRIHVTKCDEYRHDVEAALTAQFGRPVPVRIVADEQAPRTDPAPRATAVPPDPDEPEEIDLDGLTDAPDAATTGVEQVIQVFPGAEVVEEG